MALEDAHNTAAELSPARRDRVLALAEHIEDAITMCDRIAMFAKADALTNNPCAFADGAELSVWRDYLIETGRRYQ